MKKDKKIFVICLLVLVGITSFYIANSFSKYTSLLENKEGSATVATWSFANENNINELKSISVNLANTVDSTSLVDGKIAPGTKGNFILKLKNETSDVGVKFKISFDSIENAPSNLIFKVGTTSFNPATKTISGYISKGDSIDIPVEWEWAFYTDDNDDIEDTIDGGNHNIMNIKATITGEQTNPNLTITTGNITVS